MGHVHPPHRQFPHAGIEPRNALGLLDECPLCGFGLADDAVDTNDCGPPDAGPKKSQ
jgi:hypothetical protein